MKCEFMDTFIGRVHDADMNERAHATTKLDTVITTNLEEMGYGE